MTGLSLYSSSKEVVKDVNDLFPESMPPALEKARVTSSAAVAEYISRPDIEAKIIDYLDSKTTRYYVIYGAKGVGKSEVVNHTVIGKGNRNLRRESRRFGRFNHVETNGQEN